MTSKIDLQSAMLFCSKRNIEFLITNDPYLDNVVYYKKDPTPLFSINISNLETDELIEELNYKIESTLKNVDV